MRRTLLAWTFAIAMIAQAQPSAAQDDPGTPDGERFHVELATMWWWSSPGFELQTGSLAEAAIDVVDFSTDFGLAKERFSEIRVVGKIARKHRLRFSYVPIRYDAATTLSRTITFGDQQFRGPTSATVSWDLWRIGYQWNFVTRPRGSVGLVGELKYNDFHASASAGVAGAVQDVKAPIPTIGISGRAYVLPNLALSGEFTGIKVPGNDSFSGSFFDFDVSATANMGRHFGVQGGFRSVATDYLIDLDRGSLDLRGVYIGILSRF